MRILKTLFSAAALLPVLLWATPGFAQDIVTAGELFVDLDADDPTAGEEVWENAGTAGDFLLNGEVVVTVLGPLESTAVLLNPDGLQGIYQAQEIGRAHV